MSTGILKVEGDKVVGNDGKAVVLRGAGLGGWMNMENVRCCDRHSDCNLTTFTDICSIQFITGYPGHEFQHRASMLNVLGQEKYEFFFDKFLEYFFTEADAKFFASKGLNCLRLPFNYRRFEDDMNPRVLKEGGFKHLERVVELVSVKWLVPPVAC